MLQTIDLQAVCEAVNIINRAPDSCTCDTCRTWSREYLREVRAALYECRSLLDKAARRGTGRVTVTDFAADMPPTRTSAVTTRRPWAD